MEIITSTSNCKKEHHRSENNAAATNSVAVTCLMPDQSPGDFPIASCALAEEIAAFIGAQSQLDADTVQHWLSAAATEAVATYKLNSAAAAVDTATTLAEIAVKASAIAAASAPDNEPQLQHSRKAAARILDMSLRSLAAYIKAGIIKARHEGGSTKILHSEILRFLKGDCRKPVASTKKLLPIDAKQPDSVNLMVG